MKKIIFSIVIVVCFCANLKAQVIQQKANKWQLINGVKLESKTPKKNLIKLKATKISPSINSKNIDDIPKDIDEAIELIEAITNFFCSFLRGYSCHKFIL